MTEYLNKKDLLDFIKDTRQRLPQDSKDFFTRDYMLLNFEQYIHLMPAVDVVEVVRCKDCKHYLFCCRTIRTGGNRPDDFCSYGERKDG